MTTPRIQRQPTFLWQAVLILLPVAVLAVLGWYSLRQDKILAEHDAKERAQAIADELLPKIWNALTAKSSEATNRLSFQVDEQGQLIFPPSYQPVPTPKPLDLTELSAEQARLWQGLQSATVETSDADSLVQVCKDFLASQPPEKFAASASYEVGLCLVGQKRLSEAAAAFDLVATRFPNAVGETGLPLQPLALFRLFELTPRAKATDAWTDHLPAGAVNLFGLSNSSPMVRAVNLEGLCSNLVLYPSPLTPGLLAKLGEELSARRSPYGSMTGTDLPETVAAILKWQKIWQEHELARQLFSYAQPNLPLANRVSLTPFGTNEPASPAGAVFRSGDSAAAVQSASRLSWITLPDNLAYGTAKESLPEHSQVKVWFQDSDNHWLAVPRDEPGSNHWFTCWSESELGGKVTALLENERPLPEFFGVGVELAGRALTRNAPDLRVWRYESFVSKGAGQVKKTHSDERATTILTAATKVEAGAEQLKINVYLTSPTALYQRQRTRSFWFGSLIAVSTVAALIGLLTAWRAFQRQRQLSEMKSNFVSSVSHELRAPIAAVRLLAENLEREKVLEPEKQREYFRFIGQECRRLTALVENVLDFSRIEQGRKQYEFEPTDIGALVEQTVKLMQPYAVERGVKLELKAIRQRNVGQGNKDQDDRASVPHSPDNHSPDDSGGLELNVDGRAIQQALVNLIDNAVKHSPKGETVTVGIEASGAEVPALNSQLSTLNLSVTDHGPGIPPEEHAKIFERFYRRGSELRRETQGVGIGLSIVKHIVEAHGGRVIVQSQPGQGSRFTIELPMKNETSNNER